MKEMLWSLMTMKRNDVNMGVLYDMIKKLTESDVSYLDSKEYRAERMLEGIEDALDAVKEQYYADIKSGNAISNETYLQIESLYKAIR